MYIFLIEDDHIREVFSLKTPMRLSRYKNACFQDDLETSPSVLPLRPSQQFQSPNSVNINSATNL